MRTSNPIAALFGRSPFRPMQRHMEVVGRCAAALRPLFDAVVAGDRAEVKRQRDRIFEAEHEADRIKNEIRAHLPRSFLLPVDRRDLLDMLHSQDSIADCAQDVAGFLDVREMQLPEPLRDEVFRLLDRSLAAVDKCQEIVAELDELLATGFSGKEADRVSELIGELSRLETESDDVGAELVRKLFAIEHELSPLVVVFWYELSQKIGDLADHAEDAGDRLRLLLAR